MLISLAKKEKSCMPQVERQLFTQPIANICKLGFDSFQIGKPNLEASIDLRRRANGFIIMWFILPIYVIEDALNHVSA